MTKQELTVFFARIEAYYPRFCEGFTQEKMKITMGAWYDIVGDLPLDLCNMALKKHVLSTSKGMFAPSVMEIRKNAMNICDVGSETTGAEAWGEVMRAIGLHGMYNTDEAIGSMTQTTARVVKFLGWQNICKAENIDVVRGQFLKMYDMQAKREIDKKILPVGFNEQLVRLLSKFENKLLAEGGRENV